MEQTFEAVKLLGTLAVEKGWVSNHDIQAAIVNQKEGTFFGEQLLKKKLITSDQLNELLRLQQESEVKTDDFLFGQIAVHNRFIKAQDVINGIEEQKNSKIKKTLGQILKDKGLLSDQQCNAIITTQKRIQKNSSSKKIKKISCPKCKSFYQIKDAEKYRKVRCKGCQFIFEIGSPKVKVISDVIPQVASENFGTNDKSLIQYLEENHLVPQSDLSDPNHSISNESERYILGKEIARGGMGAILLTKDVNLRRNIVTKVLLNKKSKLATLRFIEEAQITGQLEHPNIPPVHDLGINKDNNVFFTMKQIKGETLLDIIKKIKKEGQDSNEKYSYKSLVSIIIKVCNALEYAHSKNVIHRDIKPENIMVGEYGEVLLMDWGLAKIIGASEEIEDLEGEKVSSVRSEDESSNTIAGTTAGTPAYMSPEQASGKLDKLDQRSDIYSLGATLFNVLSLDKPYKGSSVYELLNNVADGNMQELKGNFPPELKAITLKAMAFNQEDRYQNIVEMENDLLNYQMGYSVSAKKDSALELLKKFYNRNKLLSIVTLSFLFIFICGSTFFIISLQAQRNKVQIALNKAELAIKQFEKEKTDRLIDNKNSAPTYFVKAKNEAQVDKFNEAIKYMDTAIKYDPQNQEYLIYRGCLHLTVNNINNAIADLSLIQNHPKQDLIIKILDILKTQNLSSLSEKNKLILSEICAELKLLDVSQKLTSNIFKKLELWRNQLKSIWTKELFTLTFVNNMVTFRIDNSKENLDLSPLKGIPIQSLTIRDCRNLTNISALENMPLEHLTISGCPLLTDISALKNKKLKYIFLEKLKVNDLSPLSNSELNSLTLKSVPVTTLKPILHLPLKEIEFFDIYLTDKTELKPLPLETLTLNFSNIDSLTLLNLTHLKNLKFVSPLIVDISLLKESPLDSLDLSGTNVKDLTPIKNKDIKNLNLSRCNLTNLEVITTLKKLETLTIVPSTLNPGWEEIIMKLKGQLKSVGIGNGDYQKSVDDFLKEYNGINNKHPK